MRAALAGRKLIRWRWIWRVLILSALGALLLLSLMADAAELLIDLPVLLWLLLLWAALSVTSVLDVIFLTRRLRERKNRLAIVVLAVNAAIAGAVGTFCAFQPGR